jgi:hypothetical protein
MVAGVTVIVIGAFVFAHTGARGDALCSDAGFPPPGALSWWPPGARCTGGEPAVQSVRFDPAFLLAAPAAFFLLAVVDLGVAAMLRRRRKGSGSDLSD